MLAQITHILPSTNIRRVRILPVDGKLLVRAGQQVAAMDVLAEAQNEAKHILLDVRKVLGGGSAVRGKELVERSVGEIVQEGDIIASMGSVLRKQIHAPQAGVIAAVENGQVYLRVFTPPSQLKAGYTGIVSEIIPERGAIIEINGALLQGVWGNKKVNGGQLLMLADAADDSLTLQKFDSTPEQLRGKVLFSAYCEEEEVLQAVESRSLRGLILASMPAKLIETANSLAVPVILLEGFGRIPLNKFAYEVLSANQRRQITLNAAVWDDYIGERPEITIPAAHEGHPAIEMEVLKPGQHVRIHSAPYKGEGGVIDEVLPGSSLLPSGLRAISALVKLDGGERVLVPVMNLDVIE